MKTYLRWSINNIYLWRFLVGGCWYKVEMTHYDRGMKYASVTWKRKDKIRLLDRVLEMECY